MKNKVLAAQQEDAARRLIQTVLSREGFTIRTPEEEARSAEEGERRVVLTYQISVTGSGSTAPVQTITMSARPEELLAHTGGLRMDQVEFGRLNISYRARSVTIEDREICLTVKEVELLAYMAYHKNLVLTRAQLLAAVWEMDYTGDIRTVDTHIKCLRQKIGEYAHCIVTVRGVGYMFQWDEGLIG